MRESGERNPELPNMAQNPTELAAVNATHNVNRRDFDYPHIVVNNSDNAEYALQGGARVNFTVESLDLHIDQLTTKQLVKKLEVHLSKIFITE